MTHKRLSLLADIGGTNTRVALCDGAEVLTSSIRRFRNAEYSDLSGVLKSYLEAADDIECVGACVAAAGPVRDGVATMTNLNWTIDPVSVARATGAKTVSILNDLQAQGHALGHLDPSALTEIRAGKPAGPHAAQLVIGVGTGFNAAAVYNTAAGRLVTPSECGHITMPIRSEDDLRLSQSVEKAHGFPGVEDVLSGRGLERLYAWHQSGNAQEITKSASDIISSMQTGDDPLASASVATFSRILGAVAGDLALVHLPFGGIYLIGGVARAMQPYLVEHGFNETFRDKGRFADFVDTFSISTVEDDYAALIGCAQHLSHLTK
ncbi:glucokinase [Falsihalocynthiibacter sp. SS001]|uniref:glucokinase n=1 Tax=Falsihalocynthiibacter sp. SS001 TaxID=3349698 RepID=UPI0036D22E0E